MAKAIVQELLSDLPEDRKKAVQEAIYDALIDYGSEQAQDAVQYHTERE